MSTFSPLFCHHWSRNRRCQGSLHWYWRVIDSSLKYWKQQQTQFLFEDTRFYLPWLLAELVDKLYLYFWTIVFIKIKYKISFKDVFLQFTKTRFLSVYGNFYLPHQLTFPPPVEFCLPAAAAWGWHDVDSASSTNFYHHREDYHALAEIFRNLGNLVLQTYVYLLIFNKH